MRIHVVALASAGLAFFALSIATFVAQPTSRPRNYTLPCCLLVLAILWLGAGVTTFRMKTRELVLGPVDTGGVLLLFGGVVLVIQLSIRLLCAASFGGTIASFDFGLKCTAADAALNATCDPNMAFTPEFNSFGHCIQGSLALLLLPVAETAAAAVGVEDLVRSLVCFVAAYPIYNMVKRGVKHPAGFAASSFANNGGEWAMGFLLGLSTGLAAQAMVAARAPQASRLNHLGNGETPSVAMELEHATPHPDVAVDRFSAPPRPAVRYIRALRCVAGGALCAVGVVAAVLLGISWDNTAARPERVDDVDTVALALLLAVPVGLLAVWLVLARARRRTAGVRADDAGVSMRMAIGCRQSVAEPSGRV